VAANTDGDVLNDFLNTYAWDANGRPVAIDGVSVTYDALGRMVEQNRSGAYTEILYAPTGFELSLMNGQSYTKEFAPMPGGGASVWTPSVFYYRHADWLGSSRFASTKSRTMYYDGAYAPFGESYAESGTTDRNFTGMDQDTISTAYDFPAREYGIQGRWPSPDPAGLASVNPADPQSWNRYAYVRNSPLMMTDPTGLEYTTCYVDAGCVTDPSLSDDPNSCGPDNFAGCFGPPAAIQVTTIICDEYPYSAYPGCNLGPTIGVCDPSTSALQCGLSFGVGSPSPGPPLPVGAGGTPTPPTVTGKQSLLSCTINTSNKLTISNWLAHVPGLGKHLQDGSWARTTVDILGGGNAFAGILSAGQTWFGNSASGTALAQTTAGLMADPSMGLNPLIRAAGGEGIPSALEAIKAGGGALTDTVAEGATGVGLIKLGYDLATTLGSGAYCALTQ
jgi:RHS repeat-associated protein